MRIRSGLAICFVGLLHPALAQIIVEPESDVSLVNRDGRTVIVPARSAATLIPFSADPASRGGDVFHVVSSSAGVVVSLILPSATEITAGNAAAQGFEFLTLADGSFRNTMIPSLPAMPGTHTVIRVPPSQPPGTYQVKVNATAVAAETVLSASYYSSSPVRAGVMTDSQFYRVGDTVLLSAVLFNGSTPIIGATVTARIGDPTDAAVPPAEVTLLDSGAADGQPGDGIYSGTYRAGKAGNYLAAVRATGAANPAFSRSAFTRFQVQSPLATFASFTESGVDDNSNGKIDRVQVTAGVTVTTAGSYQFGITLEAANGAAIRGSTTASLAAGFRQIDISFPAADILRLGAGGPYRMKEAILTFQADPEIPVADFRLDAGTTAAHPLSTLDRGPLYFTGQYTATGVDTDGNGKFDTLQVAAGVSVAVAGSYHWSARLTDPGGKDIDFASGAGSLAAGADATITFDFSGSAIGQSCSSGGYRVRSATLLGLTGSLLVTELFASQTFLANQFEGSTGCGVILPNPPEVAAGGVVNNASFAPSPAPLAPGSIAAVFGSNLNDGSVVLASSFGADGKLVTTLGGASVTINDIPAPVFYSTSRQLGVQIPFETAGLASAVIRVTVGGQTSAPRTFPLDAFAPGIFTVTSDGRGAAVVLHQDGTTPVTAQNPARPGEIVVFFATGLGVLSPPLATGEPSAGSRTETPSVLIGGTQAELLFSGVAPGFAGLNQINLRIPPAIREGSAISVLLTIGGKQSNAVTIPVAPAP